MGRRVVKRGEVWWVDLGEPRGAEPAFRRPVVIAQDDLLTDSRISTVMIVPLTTNLRRAAAAGNVVLEPRDTGLSARSVALVCQVMTVDKSFFAERVAALTKRAMHGIDRGLVLALGLPG